MDVIGLGDILSNLFVKIREDHEIQAWLRLVTSLIISGVISSCGMTGLALMTGTHAAGSLGAGLFSLAGAWFGVCSVSPLGRSLIQSLPKSFIEHMQQHPDQVNVVGRDAEKD